MKAYITVDSPIARELFLEYHAFRLMLVQSTVRKTMKALQEIHDPVMFAQPSFPVIHRGAAMIQNPTNKNQILVFHHDNLQEMYIYNTKTQMFTKKCKTNFDICICVNNSNLLNLPTFVSFSSKLIVDVTKPHRIIIMAFTYGKEMDDRVGLFGIFNSKSLKWEFVDINTKIYTKFHGGNSAMTCNNNFLIISGGARPNEMKQKISVFDLNSLQLNNNNISLIGSFQIPKSYVNHGITLVKHYNDSINDNNNYDDKDEDEHKHKHQHNINNNDDNIINLSLLLFGGMFEKFKDSFSHLTIRISSYLALNSNNSNSTQNKNVSKCDENVNININSNTDHNYKIIDHEFINGEEAIVLNPRWVIRRAPYFLLKRCIMSLANIDIRFKRHTKFFFYNWYKFESYLINNRYLMLFGGTLGYQYTSANINSDKFCIALTGRMTSIIYFDMDNFNYSSTEYNAAQMEKNQSLKWNKTKYDLKGNALSFRFSVGAKMSTLQSNSVLFKNPNQYIYFISNDTTGKVSPNWKIRIDTRLAWSVERILWIAFYQNRNNKKCLLKVLSKDIIATILQLFESKSSIFTQ